MKNLQQLIGPELKLIALLSRPFLTEVQIEQCLSLIASVDFICFKSLLDQHRTWPCVFCNVKEHFTAVFPQDLTKDLAKKYQQNIRQSQLHFKAGCELTRHFNNSAIDFRIIKGYPLAQKLYGDIAKKHAKDIDIVIRPTQFKTAHDILINLGYRSDDFESLSLLQLDSFYFDSHKDMTYCDKNNVIIELHLRLTGANTALSNYLLQQLFETPRLQQQQINELIYLSWHGSHTLFHRLKWIIEIAIYLEQDEFKNTQKAGLLVQLSEDHNAMRFITLSWKLANTLWGSKIPADIIQFYNNDVIVRYLTRRSLFALNSPTYTLSIRFRVEKFISQFLLAHSWKDKFSNFLQAFKPNIVDLQHLEQLVPDRLPALYYLLRPFHLIYRLVSKK